MKIIIPGIPIAKARARHSRRGNFIHTFDPQKEQSLKTKALITELAGNSTQFDPSYELVVHLHFYFPILSTKKLSPWNINPHIYKPDLDNLIKFFLDTMNGIIYKDDCQIVELYAKKSFSQQPRTEINVMPLIRPSISDKEQLVLKIFDPTSLQEFYEDVKTLSQILQISYRQNLDIPDPEWLSTTASFLSSFSLRHADKLNKVKKIGDIKNTLENIS